MLLIFSKKLFSVEKILFLFFKKLVKIDGFEFFFNHCFIFLEAEFGKFI
jgi:hypothetical protein